LSEINNYGFEVQKRAAQSDGEFQTIPGVFIPGHGTTNLPHHYSYVDHPVGATALFYRLKQIDLDGSLHYSDPIRVDIATSVEENAAPAEFSLGQNYPNPFNPSTEIGFRVAAFGFVKLRVFDMLGREVATLVNREMAPGSYSVTLDGSKLASGLYVYKLEAGQFRDSKRLLLLR
jgi:hypothetical protein